MQIILSDHNCEGQAEAIFDVLRYQGYVALLSIELLTFRDVGLHFSANDEIVWRFCQERGYLLLTGNRTASDGVKSLEFTTRRLLSPDSLPVITVARNVYYNYYAGAGEVLCDAHSERCSTNPVIYTYLLDAMAFAQDSSFTP